MFSLYSPCIILMSSVQYTHRPPTDHNPGNILFGDFEFANKPCLFGDFLFANTTLT